MLCAWYVGMEFKGYGCYVFNRMLIFILLLLLEPPVSTDVMVPAQGYYISFTCFYFDLFQVQRWNTELYPKYVAGYIFQYFCPG